jgi:hypothetical protein
MVRIDDSSSYGNHRMRGEPPRAAVRRPMVGRKVIDNSDKPNAVMPSDVRPCPSNNPPARYSPMVAIPQWRRARNLFSCMIKRGGRSPSQ